MKIREILKNLAAEERKLNVQILEYLLQVDTQKLYLDWGFGSLFSYLTQELLYSEASAARRVATVRLMRHEDINEKLVSGSLSLTNAAQVQTALKQMKKPSPETRKELLKVVENKSTREAEKAILQTAQKIEPGFIAPQKDSLRAVDGNNSSLKITISQELETKLLKLKQLLSHKNPNLSYAELLEILADKALKTLDPEAKPAGTPAPGKSKNPRYISVKTRRQIWQNAKGQCSYQDPTTRKQCSSNHLLEIDHKIPLALGGDSRPENLRLFCKAHNQRAAEQLGILRRPGR